jgi:hypothetical protein
MKYQIGQIETDTNETHYAYCDLPESTFALWKAINKGGYECWVSERDNNGQYVKVDDPSKLPQTRAQQMKELMED